MNSWPIFLKFLLGNSGEHGRNVSVWFWDSKNAPPPPRKKALENGYGVEMHVHSPIFHSFQKNLTDNFNSLGAREGGKNA